VLSREREKGSKAPAQWSCCTFGGRDLCEAAVTEWFTADLHLGHANVIRYCDRPYKSVDDMNLDLVLRWNDVVADDDPVWILGDLCMGKLDDTLPLVKELNGVKCLLPGNHDRMFGCVGKKWFRAADRYEKVGVMVTRETLVTDVGGLTLCHFPFTGDSGEVDRFEDHRPRDRGQRLLHGHTHGRWRRNGRMVDVGVDAWNGTPVSLETVLNTFESSETWLPPFTWT